MLSFKIQKEMNMPSVAKYMTEELVHVIRQGRFRITQELQEDDAVLRSAVDLTDEPRTYTLHTHCGF